MLIYFIFFSQRQLNLLIFIKTQDLEMLLAIFVD